jgi:alginate O-acetyltransferase complex protein AlgI
MLLHPLLYLLFLAVVASVYWLLPRPAYAWRKAWLLLASYAFYVVFEVHFALLLLGLTVAVWGIGKGIARGWQPRRLAWASVLLNLGLLGIFKYAGFFVASAQAVLARAGVPAAAPALALLLPVGISFYTFQAIAYTTEIYRGKAQPASLLDFALYLAFFPKLVAGPLVRPQEFMRQVSEPAARPRQAEFTSAFGLLLLGLVKKILIADSLAGLADTAFRAASLAGGTHFATPLYLQGFYLYAFQIYADFSGYTDLARGSATLLGFALPENFRQPYFAATLGDFWNRWHMSLTGWFREYLFFPLSRWLLARGGRQHAERAQVIANLVTMALIGLWHGAAWTFVLWGLWHGVLLTLERLTRLKPAVRWQRLAAGLVTFHLVAIGWVLFRADSLASAGRFFLGLLSAQQMEWLGYYAPSILLTGALLLGIDWFTSGQAGWAAAWWPRLRPLAITASVVVLVVLGLLSYARGADARPFIYGQF